MNYKCYATVSLNGTDTNGLIDTGNVTLSAISPHLAKKLGVDSSNVSPINGLTAVGTAGKNTKLKVLGKIPSPN